MHHHITITWPEASHIVVVNFVEWMNGWMNGKKKRFYEWIKYRRKKLRYQRYYFLSTLGTVSQTLWQPYGPEGWMGISTTDKSGAGIQAYAFVLEINVEPLHRPFPREQIQTPWNWNTATCRIISLSLHLHWTMQCPSHVLLEKDILHFLSTREK